MIKCSGAQIYEFILHDVNLKPNLFVVEDCTQNFTLLVIPKWNWSFHLNHTVPHDLIMKELQQSLFVAGFINSDEAGPAANNISHIIQNEIPVKPENQ